jgi:hypothetical protein
MSNTLKYRIVGNPKNELDSFTLILADGGVADYIGADEDSHRIEFYQSRLRDAMEEHPNLDMFEALAEGKMYIEDLDDNTTTRAQIIEKMIDWLDVSYTSDVELEQDDTLFDDIIDDAQLKEYPAMLQVFKGLMEEHTYGDSGAVVAIVKAMHKKYREWFYITLTCWSDMATSQDGETYENETILNILKSI